MFDSPVVTWALTTVLLLCGSYHFLRSGRSDQRLERVNNGLHGLMHVMMVAMLWNLLPSTRPAQIAVLVGAAVWFITQAVARKDIKILCANGPGWPNCVYHSLTMASAAVMIIMMGYGATAGQGIAAAGGMFRMHDHNALATATPVTTGGTAGSSPSLAIVLTVFFAAAAGVFMVLLLRSLVTETSHSSAATPRLFIHTEHGVETLGATVMALMFASMIG